MSNRAANFLTAFGIGAGAMYFMDSARGARRRALLRDQIIHYGNLMQDEMSITARDLAHRTQGVFAAARSQWKGRNEQLPGDILVARVRSKLGRLVSHPHAVQVEVDGAPDKIVLKGMVLSDEVLRLVNGVSRVPGVRGVENRLEVHQRNEDIPALQGGKLRMGQPIDLFQRRWSPATRFLVGLCGGMIGSFVVRRFNLAGVILSGIGFSALLRGMIDESMHAPLPNSRIGNSSGVTAFVERVAGSQT